MVVTGRKTVEFGEKILFTGVVPFTILAVNPTKKELEKIYGRELEKEPEYLKEEDVDGKMVKKLRLDFIIKTVLTKDCNVEVIDKVAYFLEDRPRANKDKTKFEVINIYGETTWLTKEDIQSKTIPENLSFFSPDGMRAAYVGEADVIMFLRQYLNVPNREYKGKVIANLDDAKIAFSDIKKFLTGDVKEIASVLKTYNENKMKMLVGVRTTDDNKQYHTWFTQKPLKFGTRDFQYLAKELMERKAAGAYANVDFGPSDFTMRRYTLNATSFESPGAAIEADPLMGSGADSSIADDWFNQ